MPDKPLTVLTYAASASLAAVALVYLFSPNHLIDGDTSTNTASSRKKGVVGLYNPANDCFINCVLQSLASLGDLRFYLIREVHRRELGGQDIYGSVPHLDENGKEVKAQELLSLQSGEVTQGLKEMIDKLNERPIYRKTISAAPFIRVLENAFQTRIAKSQQDAQELLQIVAERVAEEYYAGRAARRRAKKRLSYASSQTERKDLEFQRQSEESRSSSRPQSANPEDATQSQANAHDESIDGEVDTALEEEEGFPLEGQTEARTECQHCHFVPKAKPTSFVMLNLMVPQKSSSTLNDCFDAHFKTEYIDDYKCDKCRLEHAIEVYSKSKSSAKRKEEKTALQTDIEKLQKALAEDPEKAPDGVALPDIKLAPSRKIARHIEIVAFPKVLIIHLSRSIYDLHSSSTKNLSKLTFPEKFPVGGILNRRNYKLLGAVTHRGTHNSGHYETFRRQHFYAPTSNPHKDSKTGPYRSSVNLSSPKEARPRSSTASRDVETPTRSSITAEYASQSTASPSPTSTSSSPSQASTRPSSGSMTDTKVSLSTAPPSNMQERLQTKDLKARPSIAKQSRTSSTLNINRLRRKKKPVDRWWRISDDKVSECTTSEVLGMHREIYMLFYEMERDGG